MVGGEVVTPLSTEDARLLALEAGPIRGHTIKLLIVDDAPGEAALPELRSAVEKRLPELPRWRQRLVSAPGTATGCSAGRVSRAAAARRMRCKKRRRSARRGS